MRIFKRKEPKTLPPMPRVTRSSYGMYLPTVGSHDTDPFAARAKARVPKVCRYCGVTFKDAGNCKQCGGAQ